MTYDTYQHIPVESFAEVLLRTGKLAETKTEGEEVFPTTEGMKGSSSQTMCVTQNNRWDCMNEWELGKPVTFSVILSILTWHHHSYIYLFIDLNHLLSTYYFLDTCNIEDLKG